jgi:ABC-type multidrug transport system ATPase subunit
VDARGPGFYSALTDSRLDKAIKLEVVRLCKSYGTRKIFHQWSREFEPGFHGVTGPNGSGKSTLLSVLAGAESFQGGSIIFNGQELNKKGGTYRRAMGYCPDRLEFYPFVKVNEFFQLAASARACTTPGPQHELIVGLNLGRDLDTRVDELSLGTQKKVMLVAALMNKPSLLLLDEPTDELDESSQQYLIDQLKCRVDGITIIATHDKLLLDQLNAECIDLDDARE